MTHTPTARAPVTDAVSIPCAMSGPLEVLTVYPVGKGGVSFSYGDDASVIVDGENLLKVRAIIDRQMSHQQGATREAPSTWVAGAEAMRAAVLEVAVTEISRWSIAASEEMEAAIRALPLPMPLPANIGGDSPSEREKALREALALADAEVVFAQHGIATSEAGTTERAMNVMARNTARDIAKAIKALLATPAEGGGT